MATLMIVIGCNIIKIITIAYFLWAVKEAPLVTLGDAVASCLENEDQTTIGMCLADQQNFRAGHWGLQGKEQKWISRRRFWFAAATRRRWIMCNIPSVAGIGACIFLLAFNICQLPFNEDSIPSLWRLGFGTVNFATIIDYREWSVNVLTVSLLANAPQLVLSLLYFAYNAIFTCELVGQEWNDFSQSRKPLRVSVPKGRQTSSFWFGLPYMYGVPLMAISVLLHWLYSRSLFLVDVQFQNAASSILAPSSSYSYYLSTPDDSIVQCGWSPIAVFFSIIVTALVIFIGILFGFRRYNAGIPLVGSCSAAISAACHPELDEQPDFHLRPIKWGVTSYKNGVGHCTFSSRDVPLPNEHDVYAGLSRRREKEEGEELHQDD